MKIGELAERTGLAPSRIRFYEGIGLLKVERQPNGYRTYPPQAVLVLELIATAQQAGFSLDEIRTLLPPDLAHWEHGSLIETLRSKVQDIEAKPEEIDCATNAGRVLSWIRSGELESPALATGDVTTLRKASRRRSGRTG